MPNKRKRNTIRPEEEFQDLGFGSKVANQSERLINRDGSFNVERRGLPFFQSLSFYHSLLTISWWKFNFIIIASYIIINICFAVIYLFLGIKNLEGIASNTLIGNFFDAVFFSSQTFTTVGYGVIHPTGFWTNLVASIESMFGLLGFAFATGLLYGRFSHPNAKILFSKNAIIAPYNDITAFEYRIANARKNQLIDVEIQTILSLKEQIDGRVVKRFHELKLERKQVNFFALSWTVVHPIDSESPLVGLKKSDLIDSDAEFLILLKAFDDTFSQSVHTRFSYKFNEVVWGARFKNIFIDDTPGITAIDLEKLSDIELIDGTNSAN